MNDLVSEYDKRMKWLSDIILDSDEKTFLELNEEIKELRDSCEAISDENYKSDITDRISLSLLRFAIDKSQPTDIVNKLYQESLTTIQSLQKAVSAAIEYAKHCREQQNSARGLFVLQQVKERVVAQRSDSPTFAENALESIELSIRCLEGGSLMWKQPT
jgi:hypothetical protein